jgi:hypothetical protein
MTCDMLGASPRKEPLAGALFAQPSVGLRVSLGMEKRGSVRGRLQKVPAQSRPALRITSHEAVQKRLHQTLNTLI